MLHKFFLPNSFKKPGAFMAPTGLLVWILTQQDVFDKVLLPNGQNSHVLKVVVLAVSFFSFLFGTYFVAFSKEKVEDEYIRNARLNSFQVAALFQLLLLVISFCSMFLFKLEPSGDGGLVIFLTCCILLFWLAYIVNFNLTLYRNKKALNAE